MTRTIVVLSCLAALAGAAISQVGLPGLVARPTQGDFVFVGKVKSAAVMAATRSIPPTYQISMQFEDLEMIKGDKPDMMVLNYSTRDDKGKLLQAGAKVLVTASGGRVQSIVEATDDAIKAAGGVAASKPSSKPASRPSTSASAPASAPAARAWIKVFADEAWYKEQAGKEETFTGKLQSLPEAGGMGITMRSSYYKLNDRTIHTAAAKVKALDDLVGKKVEIRGKAVNMELEGQDLKEIWPAAVRAAD